MADRLRPTTGMILASAPDCTGARCRRGARSERWRLRRSDRDLLVRPRNAGKTSPTKRTSSCTPETPRRPTKTRINGVFFAPPEHMPKRLTGTARVAVCSLVGALAFLATPAFALHKESPGAYRITTGGSHYHPPGRSWNNYFAFSSTEDLAGTGNTRREIFFFNL